jgi:hypothetical protein
LFIELPGIPLGSNEAKSKSLRFIVGRIETTLALPLEILQAAERGLDEHFGIIQIAVADILSVRLQNDIPPIRLQVAPKEAVPDQGNINTTLPFYDDPDLAQVGIAIKIAEVLADMARPHHEEEALAE